MPDVWAFMGAEMEATLGVLRVGAAGDSDFEPVPFIPHLRTDMWPYWLEESIEAAARAQECGARVLKDTNDEDATTLAMIEELRCSMRAITSAAFAVDGFYAAVKARTGPHPQEPIWRSRRTPRHTHVFETLRYYLKLQDPKARAMREWMKELFRYRGWAVHPGSKFQRPMLREDVGVLVDWHFSAFRTENAIGLTRNAVIALDMCVAQFHRAPTELRGHHHVARRAMNRVMDEYDRTTLRAIGRVEDPLASSTVDPTETPPVTG